jgi:hypothetical protein
MANNSSYTLQNLVDIARSMGDVAPVLPTGGYYEQVALAAANDAMTAMLAGNQNGSPFNWKFNRFNVTPFFINSWQQDYATANVNIGWLEICYAYNTSSTAFPKPVFTVEVKRDLMTTFNMNTNQAKIAWMQNDTLTFGTWGQASVNSQTGLTNPGPGVVYQNPLGQVSLPANPISQVQDAFGNLWVVTTYGTCGNTDPFLTNLNPQYPTLNAPTTVATTVTDGTTVWTAVNPKGQGFRISPMPSQTGPVWQIAPVAQARIPKFTSLGQYLEPIPDDYFTYFQNGFICQCYRRSADPKVRAKFETEYKVWMKSLHDAVSQGSREQDDWGFTPTGPGVMDTGRGYPTLSPALPYGPWTAY